MSTLRYDLSERPRPMGLSKRPVYRGIRLTGRNFAMECECTSGKQSFLSVVVAAKDEAASLPRLIAEIALALRPCATVVRAAGRV